MNYTERSARVGQPEYEKHFWNAMRGDKYCNDLICDVRNTDTGTFSLPTAANSRYSDALSKESLFRQIGTVIQSYICGSHILAKDCDDMAQWVPENGSISILDGMEDFTVKALNSHKLAAFVKLDSDFVRDASFDIKNYLVERLAKNFGRAEESAFISGDGQQKPTGILSETDGADVGVTASALTYDEVIRLYFSVKSEYRKNAVWLMNDKTALMLRTLKDSAGNYLWRDSDDTILGKKVLISEYMPDADPGTKPIAFGDFSYYWIVDKSPISVQIITERFALLEQVGYLAFEFLDGRLIRPEAIKVLQIAE